MGDAGAAQLRAAAQAPGGLARKRARNALARVDAGALAAHLDALLTDGSAQVRALALPVLTAGDGC
jgi:hypothetical protein